MQSNLTKKTDEQGEEDLFQLFDPEGIEFWNFLKQHKDQIINIVTTYHIDPLVTQQTVHADPLATQQTVAGEKKSKRFSLFMKDYFAEFFLTSMYLTGMFLAVLYMLAHTWR